MVPTEIRIRPEAALGNAGVTHGDKPTADLMDLHTQLQGSVTPKPPAHLGPSL